MIHRYWRGLAHHELASAYVEFLRTHTVPHLQDIPGFRGISVLKRAGEEGTEFIVITRWDTLESIVAFAGNDAERAVVPEEVRRMMREFDSRARHYVAAL
jgi:heme-degrading monooxygenase HmoA